MEADSCPDAANDFFVMHNKNRIAYLRCVWQGRCAFLRLKRVLS